MSIDKDFPKENLLCIPKILLRKIFGIDNKFAF